MGEIVTQELRYAGGLPAYLAVPTAGDGAGLQILSFGSKPPHPIASRA